MREQFFMLLIDEEAALAAIPVAAAAERGRAARRLQRSAHVMIGQRRTRSAKPARTDGAGRQAVRRRKAHAWRSVANAADGVIGETGHRSRPQGQIAADGNV